MCIEGTFLHFLGVQLATTDGCDSLVEQYLQHSFSDDLVGRVYTKQWNKECRSNSILYPKSSKQPTEIGWTTVILFVHLYNSILDKP